MWPDSSRRSSRPVQGDWEGQPEIGRHDTVFRYSFSSGNWQTILISFCGVIGLPEPAIFCTAGKCSFILRSGADHESLFYLLINGSSENGRSTPFWTSCERQRYGDFI